MVALRLRRGALAAAAALVTAAGAAPAAHAIVGITTVAGTGGQGYGGDGGAAASALLNTPTAVTPTANGGFIFTDAANHRVRVVDRNGTITTVAGDGTQGSGGDG